MIKLYKGYKYDNKYDYVKGFASSEAQTSWFNSQRYESIDDHNYVRNNNIVKVDYSLDTLREMGVNYLSYNNGDRIIYCFIVFKEYIGYNTTALHLEVDVFQTYMFDFNFQNSFIERKKCEINEITDFDEGLFLGNHSIASDMISINKTTKYFALFSGIKNFELVMDENGKIIDYLDIPTTQTKPMTVIDGIPYPLYFVVLEDGRIPTVLSDHPSLVSIIRMPNCNYTTDTIKIPYIIPTTNVETNEPTGYMTVDRVVTVATTITSVQDNGTGFPIPKTDVTDFYPYTYYVLTDGETEPLIMKPQDLPGTASVVSRHALSHQPIERYFVPGYRGDTTGRVYNITNANQMVIPTATNQGIEFLTANAGMMNLQRKGQVTENILGGVASVIGSVGSIAGGIALAPVTGGLSLGETMNGVGKLTNTANGIVGGIQAIKESDRRALDQALTPSSISSLGTPATRNAFGNGYVRILKYTVSDLVKTKIRNFVERFGNKFNNYDTINHRTYKGYIKMISPNIDTTIDHEAVLKIIDIFERGVFVD